MHDLSFNDRHFVAEELLKLNAEHNAEFNKAEDYFILFLVIKYL